MKIIAQENYGRPLFNESVIAENVDEVIGKHLVLQWNESCDELSDLHLKLVEDDYESHIGYTGLL